jgi:hypothetical protein
VVTAMLWGILGIKIVQNVCSTENKNALKIKNNIFILNDNLTTNKQE